MTDKRDWQDKAAKELKGRDATWHVPEGFAIQPLYTADHWSAAGDPSGFPGFLPLTRGASVLGNAVSGWDIRQEHGHPDAVEANRAILEDLERGVSSVQLRFDVWGSPSLPDMVKHRLTDMAGSRITKDGILILRSEGARSQLLNREEVRERLFAMIREATFIPKKRKATKPTRASQTRRMDSKGRRGTVKSLRGKVRD